MQGGRGQSTKKKETSSQYLYSSPNSVLPAQSRWWWQRQTCCWSHCCLGSGPGQGEWLLGSKRRLHGVPGLVASCPHSAA